MRESIDDVAADTAKRLKHVAAVKGEWIATNLLLLDAIAKADGIVVIAITHGESKIVVKHEGKSAINFEISETSLAEAWRSLEKKFIEVNEAIAMENN